MTHVSTIKTNTQTMTPEALQEAIRNGSIDSTKITDISVFNQSTDASACTDGKDDGSIGLLDAIGSTIKGAVKGVVNGIKGCFFDENGNFSLGNTLKTALTVGACFIPGVGPVIATGLCAYGTIKGGIGVAKGVAAAATAETDAEAKAAFESIGANGVATAASAVGLKASVSALASNVGGAAASANGTLGKLNGVRSELVSAFKQGVTKGAGLKNAANTLTGGYYGSAWANASGSTAQKLGQVAKSTLKDTGANVYKAYDATKSTIKDKTARLTGKKGTGDLNSINKKFSKEYGDIPDGEGVYTSKDGSTTLEVRKVTDSKGNTIYEYNTTKNTVKTTDYSKTTDSSTSKVEANIDDLIDDYKITDSQFDDLIGGKEITTADGSKLKYDAATDKITATKSSETITYGKDTTSVNTLDSMKNKTVEIKAADGTTTKVKVADQLKNPGDTFTAADGSTYTLNPDGKTITKFSTGNSNRFAYDFQEFKSNALSGDYAGVPQTGYTSTVGLTVASDSMTDEAQDMLNQVPYMSQTYATVDIQSGYEYDLQDYSLMDENQVNKSYSTIMSNAYGL